MPASNPNRRIKLTITTQTVYTGTSSQSYRLTVVASDGNLMPNEVFRYSRIPSGPGYPTPVDKYMGVCTPAELSSLPINDPDPAAEKPWFRKTSLDLTLPSPKDATTAVEEIVAALSQLKSALDFTDDQTQPASFWIGTPPA